jgi:site-specific recombinase XerD
MHHYLQHHCRVDTVAAVGREVDELALADLTGPLLREAFGHFAGPRAPASVERAWTTWNQFLAFCVAEGLMPGNPMPAVPRPKPTPLSPKPLHGDNTPEQLLEAVATGVCTNSEQDVPSCP